MSAPALRALFLPSGKVFDNFWQNQVSAQVSQQWASAVSMAQTVLAAKTLLIPPEGRGGMTLGVLLFLVSGRW